MNDIDIFEDLDNSNNVENNKQSIEGNSNIEYIEVFRSKKTLRRYELFNVNFYSYGSLSINKRKWKYLNNNSNNSNNSDSDNENNNDDNNRFESWCNQNMCGDDCFSGSEDNDRRACCHKCNERVHGNESEEFKKCVGCCEQHGFGTDDFEKCIKEKSKCGTIPGFCAYISKNNCEMKECMKWFNDDPDRIEDYFFTCEAWKPRSENSMYSSYAYYEEDLILNRARYYHVCDPCATIFACDIDDVLNDKKYQKCNKCKDKYGYMSDMFKRCMEKEINKMKKSNSRKEYCLDKKIFTIGKNGNYGEWYLKEDYDRGDFSNPVERIEIVDSYKGGFLRYASEGSASCSFSVSDMGIDYSQLKMKKRSGVSFMKEVEYVSGYCKTFYKSLSDDDNDIFFNVNLKREYGHKYEGHTTINGGEADVGHIIPSGSEIYVKNNLIHINGKEYVSPSNRRKNRIIYNETSDKELGKISLKNFILFNWEPTDEEFEKYTGMSSNNNNS